MLVFPKNNFQQSNSPVGERPNTIKFRPMLISNEQVHALVDRFMQMHIRVLELEEVTKITISHEEHISAMEAE